MTWTALLYSQSGARTGRATSTAAKALQEQALEWVGAPFYVLARNPGQRQSSGVEMIWCRCGPGPAACAGACRRHEILVTAA